ncbi:bile acid:sodium symporter family protein [Altererythrobacter sp. C41]|uniref:bile acid:sodium symporter family protein n=1 Tax=Altererythrobacter sp. C41 TaxID=2806021 RepID=UPI003082AA84
MAIPILSRIDPMVRLLVVAIALATICPAVGEGREVVEVVSNFAIFALFALNGLRLPRGEVLHGVRHGRFLVPLLVWCFGAMALTGLGLSRVGAGHLPQELAIGLLFLGTLASTVQSATAYSSLAGGNVARSVVAAALINIAGVFVTAPLFAVMGGFGTAEIGIGGLGKILALLVVPFVLGQALQGVGRSWVQAHPALVSTMDRLAIAIAVYVAFSGAVERGIWTTLEAGQWAILLGLLLAFLAIGFGGSWLFSGLFRLDRPTRISFMFAGAHKSVVSGAPIALILFPPASAGLVMAPLLAYHLLQLVVSAPLASRLSHSRR